MFDSGGQRNVAKLHGACRDFNGYIGCYHAMHSSDMLCHAGSEYKFSSLLCYAYETGMTVSRWNL